jgi:hypothetical protein
MSLDFRLELQVKPWKDQIHLKNKIFLIGSCFTEHMSARLRSYRFHILENPHGILFNPHSIAVALKHYHAEKEFKANDVFRHNELWQSWDHHGRFASLHADACIALMNSERKLATSFLKQADWMIVTLGSSFIYELNSGPGFTHEVDFRPVANCHKVPAQHFRHRLMEEREIVEAIQNIIVLARQFHPHLKIIFTISPVRHHREGLVENNRSKGRLHSALATLLETEKHVYYFPAYELVVDDLRDYRFFAEDLVHPNYFATRYVWEKFSAACIDAESISFMERIKKIQDAMHHRPRQPESAQHLAFISKMKEETKKLSGELPYLDFSDALSYFGF